MLGNRHWDRRSVAADEPQPAATGPSVAPRRAKRGVPGGMGRPVSVRLNRQNCILMPPVRGGRADPDGPSGGSLLARKVESDQTRQPVETCAGIRSDGPGRAPQCFGYEKSPPMFTHGFTEILGACAVRPR